MLEGPACPAGARQFSQTHRLTLNQCTIRRVKNWNKILVFLLFINYIPIPPPLLSLSPAQQFNVFSVNLTLSSLWQEDFSSMPAVKDDFFKSPPPSLHHEIVKMKKTTNINQNCLFINKQVRYIHKLLKYNFFFFFLYSSRHF